jgi:hypothetical protein
MVTPTPNLRMTTLSKPRTTLAEVDLVRLSVESERESLDGLTLTVGVVGHEDDGPRCRTSDSIIPPIAPP